MALGPGFRLAAGIPSRVRLLQGRQAALLEWLIAQIGLDLFGARCESHRKPNDT